MAKRRKKIDKKGPYCLFIGNKGPYCLKWSSGGPDSRNLGTLKENPQREDEI